MSLAYATHARDLVDTDRAVGSLLGLAIGDALGTTLEFSARGSRPRVTDLVGGGPFGLKPGEWTDDTSMALCLAESLVASGGELDAADLMRRFGRWYRSGENSVTGRCFDIGITTRTALEHFGRTGETAADLPEDEQGAGNGTLMRLAPVAIVAAPDADRAADLADAQSRTTHRAPVAHEACRYFATLLVEAMTGRSKAEVLRPRRDLQGRHFLPALAPVAEGLWRDKTESGISSSGYVVATLEASLWCVGTTDTFADAVLRAANLGDDADTVAAVTGQLAGALYGRPAIPERWLARLAWRERIEDTAQQLLSVGQRARSDRGGVTHGRGVVAERPEDLGRLSPPLRIAEVRPATGGCIGITFAPGKKQLSAFSGQHDRPLLPYRMRKLRQELRIRFRLKRACSKGGDSRLRPRRGQQGAERLAR